MLHDRVRYSTWSAVASSVWANAFQLSATAHSKMRSMVVFSEERLLSIFSRVPDHASDIAVIVPNFVFNSSTLHEQVSPLYKTAHSRALFETTYAASPMDIGRVSAT